MKALFYRIKRFFYALLGIFSPRSGLVPAAIEFNRAIAEARAKNARDGHRYFAIWDSVNRHLVTLTYDGYHGRTDSYQYMRQRGAFPPTSRQKFKESCFYYTASKNGYPAMSEQETRDKLQVLRARYFTRHRSAQQP